MTKRLQRIAPLQCGIVLCILYGLLTLIFVPFFILAVVFGEQQKLGSMMVVLFLIGIPIAYAIMGFIFGVIAAAVYNLIAAWTGGLEFTFSDPPQGSLEARPPALP
jgi:hypothetical protein